MDLKLSLLAGLGLACAGCASTTLQPVSRVVRHDTAMRVDRGTDMDDLMVSNFYYGRGSASVTPALLDRKSVV